MRKEIAGAFFGNDKRPSYDVGKLANVLRLLALGEKVINLKETEFRAFIEGIENIVKLNKKFSKSDYFNVCGAGSIHWNIEFKAAEETCDDGHYQLWIGNETGTALNLNNS